MSELKIRDVMTSNVVTLRGYDTLKDATVTFALDGISGAPVIDDEGRLIGILSETDILDFVKQYQEKMRMAYPSMSFITLPFDELMDDEELAKTYSDISNTKVEEIMTKAVLTVTPDTDVAEAIEGMMRKEVNRVPVIEQDKVVGIVTRGDIIWSMYRSKMASE
jgi:CBS domain-containing protein